MDVTININAHLLDWLSAADYSVRGLNRETIGAMFEREAVRQAREAAQRARKNAKEAAEFPLALRVPA